MKNQSQPNHSKSSIHMWKRLIREKVKAKSKGDKKAEEDLFYLWSEALRRGYSQRRMLRWVHRFQRPSKGTAKHIRNQKAIKRRMGKQ